MTGNFDTYIKKRNDIDTFDRVPHYSHETLTMWYTKGPAVLKYRLFKYYLKRVQLNLDLLDASQVVTRTCESARIYGVDFYSVLSRGSQYKVESIMFRIAKPENFVFLTPSRKQVTIFVCISL